MIFGISQLRGAWYRSLVTALLLAAVSASAQTPICPIAIPTRDAVLPEYAGTLVTLANSNCLGDTLADKHPLVSQIDQKVNQPIVLGQTERLIAALDVLLDEATKASASGIEPELWSALVAELGRIKGLLTTMQPGADGQQWVRAMNTIFQRKWSAVGAGGNPTTVLADKPFKLLNVPTCVAGKPCPEFHSHVRVVRIANLMGRFGGYTQQPALEREYEDSALALARWQAYREKSHHQYIWEVALNGVIMEKDHCRKQTGTGMKLGFCTVPNSQWILLHPEGALRFARSATKASELKPAILVEVLGWYGWEWAKVDGRDTAELANRRGYSLAATYSQTETEKRWAFGPMFHYGDYSLALTKAGNGGKWSLVLNLALGERYFGRKQAVVDELAKVRKTDVLDLLFK